MRQAATHVWHTHKLPPICPHLASELGDVVHFTIQGQRKQTIHGMVDLVYIRDYFCVRARRALLERMRYNDLSIVVGLFVYVWCEYGVRVWSWCESVYEQMLQLYLDKRCKKKPKTFKAYMAHGGKHQPQPSPICTVALLSMSPSIQLLQHYILLYSWPRK